LDVNAPDTPPVTPSRKSGDEGHKERLVAAGRLSAMANHEMRQPLLGIKAFSALIEGRADVPDDVRAWAAKIHQQARRLERLVCGLRDLARPVRRHVERVSLDEAVADVLGFAGFLFREPGVVLRSRLDAAARVDLCVDEFQQLVLNLLANARDAVVERGGGRVQIASLAEAGSVDLYIADDGPGMPEAVRQDLDASYRTTKRDGTGLGLKVCRQIAQAHGGSLELVDDPPAVIEAPVRTVFRLRLAARV